ncbi:hypothetical protein LUZ63_004482 [Rhynchospora breviuscula]|uniref:RanBP2-type domain-containing protein n=1 Tax=Rhynchospora breviuscula TaxID=2022672 RepID=A0A9Q0D3I1_9POAL|nr:hypothetical protein LUZ63_004482 [Rhynchospora breviuscula]
MNKKPGDWNCNSCNYLNFSRREMCQRCGDPRPASSYSPVSSGSGRTVSVLRGDWYCSCGYHNFASRANCLKCGASKSDPGGGANAENRPFLPGDWKCTRPGCNEHNFASRTECYRCNAPRESAKEN